MEEGEELGDGRAEGSSATVDGGLAEISLILTLMEHTLTFLKVTA